MEYFTERKAARRRRTQRGLSATDRRYLNAFAIQNAFFEARARDPELRDWLDTVKGKMASRLAYIRTYEALRAICCDGAENSNGALYAALESLPDKNALRAACHMLEAALRRGLT